MPFSSLSRLPAGLTVRKYQPADLPACERLYATVMGEFVPENPEVLIEALSTPFSHCLVVERAGEIVALGGVNLSPDSNQARFFMGLVRRDQHGAGLGSLLVFARLALVDGSAPLLEVGMETSAKTEPFYRRFGFVRVRGPEERHGHHTPFVNLVLPLTWEERDEIRALLPTLPVEWRLKLPAPHPERPALGWMRAGAAACPRVTIRWFPQQIDAVHALINLKASAIPAFLLHEKPVEETPITPGEVELQVLEIDVAQAEKALAQEPPPIVVEERSPVTSRALWCLVPGILLWFLVHTRLFADPPALHRLLLAMSCALCGYGVLLTIHAGRQAPPRPDRSADGGPAD